MSLVVRCEIYHLILMKYAHVLLRWISFTGVVSTTAQTMTPCNENRAQDVVHGQLFFDKEFFYTFNESIKQFL